MEIYIPPPTYYPRLPPPRPVLPTVPVVPCPDLPDVLHAPEGPYTLATNAFPEVEQPGPLPMDTPRPGVPPGGTGVFTGGPLIGAAGFGMSGPAFIPLPPLSSPNIYAVSAGSTLVNGQWQPGHPCRLAFADVWYPSRVPGKESSFGALVRLGLGKKAVETPVFEKQEAPPLNVYDDEYTDSEEEDGDDITAPAVTQHAPLPGAAGPDAKKFGKATKKEKKNADKSLSSTRGGIITRVSPNLNLGSIMDEKGKNGAERVRWAFWNMGRLFVWAEEGGTVSDNLATVVFQSPPTAHAISQLTVGPERQDIVVGLETGDLIYLDFINDRMERFNTGGKIIKSPVTSIHFDPRGGDRFLVLFGDNTVAQYCLFAEDPSDAAVPIITASPRPWTTLFEQAEIDEAVAASQADTAARTDNEKDEPSTPVNGTRNRLGSVSGVPGRSRDRRPFQDRVIEWKNDEWNVPANERSEKKGETPKHVWAGKNPLAVSRLGTSSPITAMAYSPDGRWLAITTKDGVLRLVETEENRVTDVFESYFAALKCIAWSPDSRFLAVGGMDDLVTIYSARESRVVARCQGHTGFVTCIAFDPTMRSEGRGYRFGSVGEDGKLLLWDFSAAALRKPRHHHSNSAFRSQGGAGPGSSASLTLFQNIEGAHYHPAPPRAEVALLQPVLARIVEGNLMTSLHMGPNTIATVSRAGSIKFWNRPPRAPRKRGREKKKEQH